MAGQGDVSLPKGSWQSSSNRTSEQRQPNGDCSAQIHGERGRVGGGGTVSDSTVQVPKNLNVLGPFRSNAPRALCRRAPNGGTYTICAVPPPPPPLSISRTRRWAAMIGARTLVRHTTPKGAAGIRRHPRKPHPPRDVLQGKGPQRRPQRRLGRRLEEGTKAVGGGYCRLQMPWRLALAVRGTVARHRLGALEGGGGGTSPPSNLLPIKPRGR